MSYTEILVALEADEIDFVSALELAGCETIIELYEGAADEEEALHVQKGMSYLQVVRPS